jgi:uncharacterized protein
MLAALRAGFLAVFSASLVVAPFEQDTPLSSSSTAAQREFTRKVIGAAIEQTRHPARYDSSYVRIPYPGGDVPADTGVCTDVVIRAYRAAGVDLQKEVHEDMAHNLTAYRQRWATPSARTDTNIDHRRVPNLATFFSRKGQSLPPTTSGEDYVPGDLVTWDLGGGVAHIGIVVDRKLSHSGRYLVVHNIGRGPMLEDVLFSWKITGHYRYFGDSPREE